MAHEGALPKIQRHITTHDADGKAIFSDTVQTESVMNGLEKAENMGFALSYVTKGFPVDLNEEADIKSYQPFLHNTPGLSVTGGSVLRHVDFPPNNTPLMHRTISIDYGVVLEGEVELILEDVENGERRIMKRGDVCVQRATMHAWRNTSSTEWARMLFVLLPAKDLVVEGNKLGEELGTAKGVIKESH